MKIILKIFHMFFKKIFGKRETKIDILRFKYNTCSYFYNFLFFLLWVIQYIKEEHIHWEKKNIFPMKLKFLLYVFK